MATIYDLPHELLSYIMYKYTYVNDIRSCILTAKYFMYCHLIN